MRLDEQGLTVDMPMSMAAHGQRAAIQLDAEYDDDLEDVVPDPGDADRSGEPQHDWDKATDEVLQEEIEKVVRQEKEMVVHNETIRASRIALKMIWAWCWNDAPVLKQHVRKLHGLRICQQVLMGSGLMQLMGVRCESFYHLLDTNEKARCNTLYTKWGHEMIKEKKTWKGTERLNLGQYAKHPRMLQTRVLRLDEWLQQKTGNVHTLMTYRKLSWVLVLNGVWNYDKLVTVTELQIEESLQEARVEAQNKADEEQKNMYEYLLPLGTI